MTVRIERRIAQNSRHAILESFRNKMLQTVGLFVHFVPRILQDIVQEKFQQAMVPHEFPTAPLARRRKAHSVMLLVDDQRWLLRRELLQHPCD